MDKDHTQSRFRTARALLLALVCVLAAFGLLFLPAAGAQTAPPPDPVAAALARLQALPIPRPVGPVPRVVLARPPFVCQLLAVRMPAPVRNLLRSLGVGPCASA